MRQNQSQNQVKRTNNINLRKEITKQQFVSRPSIATLPKAEKDRRWRQRQGLPVTTKQVPNKTKNKPNPRRNQQLRAEGAKNKNLQSKLHSGNSKISRVDPQVRTATHLVRNNGRQMSVLPCTLDYAYALMDPFSFNGEVCVPDIHSIDSFKYRSFARGGFTAGPGGNGFIVHNPHHACSDYVLCLPSYLIQDFTAVVHSYPILVNSTIFTGTQLFPTTKDNGTVISPALTYGHSIINAP